jgi:hypothetical protein
MSQLVDLEKKIESEKSKKSSGVNDSKTVKKEETKTPANPSNVISTKTEMKNTESKKTAKEEERDEEEENENKIRGYKLTTDGRKTTFFNNEMDEQTKALIGNIAPQKIECSDAAGAGAGGVSNGGSAWNAAGTFESVDHCKFNSHLSSFP